MMEICIDDEAMISFFKTDKQGEEEVVHLYSDKIPEEKRTIENMPAPFEAE